MKHLPIVERELRVAARQAKTWWRRILSVGVALGFLLFGYAVTSSWGGVNRLGRELFAFLGGFAMVYALLAGPLWTSDCLARERRDGTLGLLFLTNLRGYDVVLGKLAAASLDMLLGLVAMMPLIAIPILLGGVSIVQFWVVVFSVGTLLFFSLATGVCASALFTSGRAAIALTFGWLSFLTLGLPLLGETVFHIHLGSSEAPYFYACCPAYTMEQSLGVMKWPTWKYWLNLGTLLAVGCLCLATACRRTATSWRTDAGSGVSARFMRWWNRLNLGNRRAREAWRATMLSKNPVGWLEGRDVFQTRLLMMIIVLCTAVWLMGLLFNPHDWLDDEVILVWGMFAHYILCFWIAVQAPRRLADDKQSGALELLLCTPITPKRIVSGLMATMRRRFGRVLLWLCLLNTALVWAYVYNRMRQASAFSDDLVQLAMMAALVCPVQAYAFARVGLYQGLAQGHSIRATLMLIWKIGLLPWVLFIGGIIIIETNRSFFRGFFRLSDEVLFGFWALCHLAPSLVFLAQANWHLQRNFRYLAVHSGWAWWKSWFRLRIRGSNPRLSGMPVGVGKSG